MLAEISMGLGSLKAATDILKGLNAAATQVAINDAKIALQGHIFDAREALSAAQESQAASLQRIRDLEAEVRAFETWETEKQRYELEQVRSGGFVYTLKEGVEPPEPTHKICAACYQHRKKSVLQPEDWYPGRCDVLSCHQCGSAVYLAGNPHPDHAKLHYRR